MSICLFGTVVTTRRSEEFLPVSLLGMAAFAYVFGLFGSLYAGVWIALIAGLLLGMIAVILVLTKKCRFEVNRFFTPAFFAYTVLLALSAFVSFGRAVSHWDECSHWAISVKSMIDARDFATSPASHILFRSYPPGVTIIQYLYQVPYALFTGGAYSEWLLYGAYNACCFSMLMPCLRFIQKRPWLYTPILAAVLVIVPMCFFDEMYASLYVDMLLGILAAYALSLFRREARDGFDILSRCVSLILLVLVKDAGLYFAVMIPAYFFLSDWVAHRRALWRPKRLWPFGAYALSVVFAKWSWSRQIAGGNVPVNFSQSIDLGMLWRIITGAEQGYQRTIFENYFKKFFSPIIEIGSFQVSFFLLFFGMAVATVLLYLLIAKKEGVKKRTLGGVLAPLFITTGYILGLCVIYLFKFGEYEGVGLASYARYIKVAYLMWALFLIAAWLMRLLGYVRRPLWIFVCILCASLGLGVMKSDFVQLFTRESVQKSVEKQAPRLETAERVKENTEPEERVYILTQELDGYDYYILRYLLYPQRINYGGFSIGQPFYEGDRWTVVKDVDAWRTELMADFDYVLVYQANAFLNEDFGALFPEGAKDGTLYRVEKADGTLRPVD